MHNFNSFNNTLFYELPVENNKRGDMAEPVKNVSSFEMRKTMFPTEGISHHPDDTYIDAINKYINIEIGNVAKEFFSKKNVSRIQNKLKQEIYQLTKVTIAEQEVIPLLIVMCKIYNGYGKTSCTNVIRYTKYLTQKTLELLVPNVLTNLKQLSSYVKEINSPLKPIARPLSVNIKGMNSLSSIAAKW